MTTIDQRPQYEPLRSILTRVPSGSMYSTVKVVESSVQKYIKKQSPSPFRVSFFDESRRELGIPSEASQLLIAEALTVKLIHEKESGTKRSLLKGLTEILPGLPKSAKGGESRPSLLDTLSSAFSNIEPNTWKKIPRNASEKIDKIVYDD